MLFQNLYEDILVCQKLKTKHGKRLLIVKKKKKKNPHRYLTSLIKKKKNKINKNFR